LVSAPGTTAVVVKGHLTIHKKKNASKISSLAGS
jgi:hypothetical protein